MNARKGRLGILVAERARIPPFADSRYYRQLCLLGQRHHLQVYVFSPGGINLAGGTVIGYEYVRKTGNWQRRIFPLPDMIYDRCFITDHTGYNIYRSRLRQLRKRRMVKFLNTALSGKWQVKEMLAQTDAIAPYLPDTGKWQGPATIHGWLARYGDIFLKPQGGSQGKGAMRITAAEDRGGMYAVTGRDRGNRLYHRLFDNIDELADWLRSAIGRRRYVIQPYLQLTTEQDEPFDIRSFVQKNRQGRWQLIGLAVRKGKPGALTSNLHGGGAAESAEPFLCQHFAGMADSLLEQIQSLTMTTARSLESRYGRLLELGLDFGVDRDGRLWLLEVNSKPGRSIFLHTGDRIARLQAVSNPILYACYLWDRQLGG